MALEQITWDEGDKRFVKFRCGSSLAEVVPIGRPNSFICKPGENSFNEGIIAGMAPRGANAYCVGSILAARDIPTVPVQYYRVR
jgi:hypothetical protein